MRIFLISYLWDRKFLQIWDKRKFFTKFFWFYKCETEDNFSQRNFHLTVTLSICYDIDLKSMLFLNNIHFKTHLINSTNYFSTFFLVFLLFSLFLQHFTMLISFTVLIFLYIMYIVCLLLTFLFSLIFCKTCIFSLIFNKFHNYNYEFFWFHILTIFKLLCVWKRKNERLFDENFILVLVQDLTLSIQNLNQSFLDLKKLQ